MSEQPLSVKETLWNIALAVKASLRVKNRTSIRTIRWIIQFKIKVIQTSQNILYLFLDMNGAFKASKYRFPNIDPNKAFNPNID